MYSGYIGTWESFTREEMPIEAVKEHMRERGIETR
jgi:hypothetical protein